MTEITYNGKTVRSAIESAPRLRRALSRAQEHGVLRVADEMGIPYNTLYKIARQAGIDTPRGWRKSITYNGKTVTFRGRGAHTVRVALCTAEGEGMPVAQRKMNLPHATLYRWCKQAGILETAIEAKFNSTS